MSEKGAGVVNDLHTALAEAPQVAWVIVALLVILAIECSGGGRELY